jgi:hypothetical protein
VYLAFSTSPLWARIIQPTNGLGGGSVVGL